MTTFSANTQKVMDWFGEIAKIPRCSKKEEKIRAWLMDWAKENSFDAKEDAAGNIVIKVPATKGYEKAPILVLQGHCDMVCEKTPDSTHDFDNDPIELVYEGEWLTANKTTLGADNGIAIALAMAMALDENVEHPPLEILITVDEETGLTGANALEPGFIDGKVLLNIDSEDEGVFTVGCAGGIDSDMTIPVSFEPMPAGNEVMTLTVGGLKGGHSGVDIHEQRGNAIKVLVRTINAIANRTKLRIIDIKGGSAHNAIPRDASAILAVESGEEARKTVEEFLVVINSELNKIEPNLSIEIKAGGSGDKVFTDDAQNRTMKALYGLPHGIDSYSYVIEGLVETSNNLATVKIEDGNLRILSSQRSSLVSRLEALTKQINSVAELAGGSAHSGDGYPPWEANWDSQLLKKCVEVYKKKFGKEPVVEVIHAGLECGIIGSKYEGMDMISLGPTIKNPHSPDEKLKVTDLDKIWDFMAELFKTYK